MIDTEQANVLSKRREGRGEDSKAATLSEQHEARVKEVEETVLLDQQQKKEQKRLSLFVKDYFAEFFLASMSIIGMILSVMYLLAHTWQ